MTSWGSKGVFFTVTAIILLGVLFTSLMFQSRYSFTERNQVVSLRAASLQNFARGMEQDTKKGLFISGFRAVLGEEELIFSTNAFLNGSKAGLIEAVINGTVNGHAVSTMANSTLPEWLSRMKSEASKLGLLMNLTFTSVTVGQSSPWAVDFTMVYSYNLTDVGGTAAFLKTGLLAVSSVSILGFADPVYSIYTFGKIQRVINSTQFEGNYASGLDTTNLTAHIDRFYYANSTGPNFLMRLEGNLSDSSTGIESIVRLPDLEDQGLPVYERSSVDYIYFNTSTPIIYKVNNTYESWFRLDAEHLYKYQVYNIRK